MRTFFAFLLLGGLVAVRATEQEQQQLSAQDEADLRQLEDPVWLQRLEDEAEQLLATHFADKLSPGAEFHQFPEDPHRRLKRSATPVNCPPGYTGLLCESPICNTTGKIVETQKAGVNTVIEQLFSPACAAPTTIYVDTHVNILVVDVTTSQGGRPAGDLFNPDGNKVVYTRQHSGSTNRRYTYINVVKNHGPGVYTFAPASQNNDDCLVRATATTPLVVYGGFVNDIFSDETQRQEPDLVSVQKYPMQLVPASFAFTVKNLSYAESVNVVSFHRSDDKTLQYPPLVVGKRYNCAAGSFVGPYICTDNGGKYYLKVRGIDDSGNVWQRVYSFECDGNPTIIPPSTPSPPPVATCQNGGTLVQLRNQKVCACTPHFTGRVCETKLCSNDATLDDQNNCVCTSDAYSGDFCQHIHCKKRAADFSSTKRGLAFVVRAHKNDTIRAQIAKAATKIVNYFDQDMPGAFDSFVLSLYINGKIARHYTTPYQDKFLGAFERFKDYWEDTTDCNDAVFGTLDEIFFADAITKYVKSPIFIFTDALPNDDTSTKLDVVNQLSEYQSPIFTILYEEPGCQFSPRDNGYDDFRRLARFTNGLVVKVGTDGDTISNTAYFLAQGFFNTNLLLGNDLIDSCQYAPAEQLFFVDETVQTITVAAVGSGIRIRLLDTNDQKVEVNNTYTVGDLTLDLFDTLDKGHYRLTVDSNGQNAPCHYRVYAQSRYEAFFGATYSIGEDRSLAQPIYNRPVHLVGVVNWAEYPDPENIQAEIIIWDNADSTDQDQRRMLFASNGVYRDDCSYNLYFGSWTCKNQNRPFYVNIYVTDSTGFTVMRTTSGHCATNTVPTTGCRNGGVPFQGGCLCPGGWEGDKCQKAVCLNDGTSRGEYCECPPTFGGLHCEMSACLNQNQDETFQQKAVTVSIIVQKSNSMTSPLLQMQRVLTDVIGDLQYAHPEWIHKYTLWEFDDQTSGFLTRTSDPNALNAELNLWIEESRGFPFMCKDLNVIDVLIKALVDDDASKYQQVFLYVYGGMKYDLDRQQELTKLIDQLEAKIHVIQTVQNRCFNNTAKEMVGIVGIAEYSGGHYSFTSDGTTLLSLPLQYQTNIVYEETRPACTDTQTFYFPVASEAQTVAMVIRGDVIPPVTFTPPDGSSLEPIQVWAGQTDSMYVAMRECNPGWNQQGKLCYRTSNGIKATWNEARTRCMNDGGALATVENSDVYTYVANLVGGFNAWVGANDKRIRNTWEWDRGNNPPIPLTYTDAWKAGEPQQANGDCALMSKDGMFAANCSTRRDYICVVHAYDMTYDPGSNTQGHLPRGIWQVSFTPFDDVVADCGLRVDVQSATQVFRRFDTVNFTDYGEKQAVIDYPNNYQMIHVSSGVDQFNEQSFLEYAQYSRGKSKDVDFVSNVWQRDQCTYEYVTEAFQPEQMIYQVTYTGFDASGYPFQRILPMLALSDQVDCQNGGVKPASDNRCVCPPDFVGKECVTPVCYKGVNNPASTQCWCHPGYMGNHCQYPNCTRGSNDGPPPPTAMGKTFGLVLDGSATGNNADFLNSFTSIMDSVFNQLPGGLMSNWFTDYMGQIAYDKTQKPKTLGANIVTNNKADFEAQITSTLSNQYVSTGGRARSFMTALYKILVDPNFIPDSPIFIITDSAVEDYDQFNQEIRDMIAEKHAQIHVFTLNDAEGPGGAGYNDQTVQPLLILPFSTGGGFYQVPSASKLSGFWGPQLLTFARGYGVDHSFYQRCSDKVEYFQVGGEDTMVTIDVFSPQDQNLTVIDNNGKKIPVTTSKIYKSKTNYLWTMDLSSGAQPGVWQVAINHKKKPMPCIVAIRVNRKGMPAVGFNTDVGKDQGHHSNGAQLAPEAGVGKNSIIAYASSDTLRWVNVYDRDTSRLVFSSPLIVRTEFCTWNYVSLNLFTCTSQYHTVAVEGYDSIGHPFRRIYKTHCVGFENQAGFYTPRLPAEFFNGLVEYIPPTDEQVEQERQVEYQMAYY